MSDPQNDPAPASKSRVPLIAGIVVVVLAVLVGGFLYLTRDTSEPELQLSDSTSSTTPGAKVDVADLEGTWTVVPGTGDDETVAGYRVQEVFAAGARRATAVGRTNDVTGTLTVANGEVTSAEITVDTTTLVSDESIRDNAIKGRGLQTDEFPEATFALTEPIELPAIDEGGEFEILAAGELTLHGVTNEVDVPLTVRFQGDTVAIAGSVPITMADYDIEPPSVGGVVEVDDNGTLEFIVNLEQG